MEDVPAEHAQRGRGPKLPTTPNKTMKPPVPPAKSPIRQKAIQCAARPIDAAPWLTLGSLLENCTFTEVLRHKCPSQHCPKLGVTEVPGVEVPVTKVPVAMCEWRP